MIFRNSMAVTAAKLTGYVFSFVLAPIMLAQLGLAEFGVWAVVGAMTTYTGLMDLGVTRAIGRFVAYFDAREDRRSVEECFGLGLLTIAVVSSIAGVIAFFAAPWVAGLLDDVLTEAEMRVVMLSAVALFALNGFRSVMRAVPEGLQQMIPPYVADIVANTVNFVFSLVVLFALPGNLPAYALAQVAAGAAALIPAGIALRYVWSPVRVHWPSRPVVKEVLSFSLKTQLAWIGDLVNNQADKIIIALFIDVRVAGAYEIANRAVVAVKSIAILSISAMIPAATAQIEKDGIGIIRDFYKRYTTRSLGVALPLMAFTSVSAPAFLVAWLGDVPDNATLVFVVLVVANMVNLSTGVAFTLSLGAGRANMVAIASAITVFINIAMTLALTPFFGLWGVVGGTLFGIVGGSVVFLVYFHRLHSIPAGDYVRAAGRPAAIALLAGIPALVWLLVVGVENGDRLGAFLATSAFFAVYLVIYWPLASRMDLLPDKLNLRGVRAMRWSRA